MVAPPKSRAKSGLMVPPEPAKSAWVGVLASSLLPPKAKGEPGLTIVTDMTLALSAATRLMSSAPPRECPPHGRR